MAKSRRIVSRRAGAGLKLRGALKSQAAADVDAHLYGDGVVGSPLLRGLLSRSQVDVGALAAKTWDEVTGGAGVVLVDGKPVDPKGGA